MEISGCGNGTRLVLEGFYFSKIFAISCFAVGVCVVGYKGYVCLDVGFLFLEDVRMYFRFILFFFLNSSCTK